MTLTDLLYLLITCNSRLPSIKDNYLNNYIFAQDDVQRKLALFLAVLYNVMYVSASHIDLCPNRETLFNSETQIVSFHIGICSLDKIYMAMSL